MKRKVVIILKNRIRELRKQKGLSQQELADQIGVTRQAISLYEKGSRIPSEKVWEKIASIFANTIKKECTDSRVSPVDYVKGYGLIEKSTIDMVIYLMHNEYFNFLKVSNSKTENLKTKETFVNAVNDYLRSSNIHPLPENFYPENDKNHLLNDFMKKYWKNNFSFLFNNLVIAQRLNDYIASGDRAKTINYLSGAIDAYNFRLNKSTLGQKFREDFIPVDDVNHSQMYRKLISAKDKTSIVKIIDEYISKLTKIKNSLL